MKKESSLISVVVPVYNVEKYVAKCLESLMQQSYQNIEIIVIDDGSTDGSGQICDELAAKDSRVRVFHKKNGGLSSARNAGIQKVSGEFLCFVDSDDYVRKDFIKELFKAIIEQDADIAICGYNNEVPSSEVIAGEDATIKLLICQENMEIIAWNKMYRTELFTKNKIEFPEGLNHEDNLTTYKVLSFAKKVIYVPKSLYVYVEREGSIMRSGKITERLKMREMAAKEAIIFFKKNAKLLAAAKISLLLAKYAFLDFSINGTIGKEYGGEALEWIKANMNSYRKNPFLTTKLKIYNFSNVIFGGKIYWIFRKIWHE